MLLKDTRKEHEGILTNDKGTELAIKNYQEMSCLSGFIGEFQQTFKTQVLPSHKKITVESTSGHSVKQVLAQNENLIQTF